jgi:branched-chain amino acid transport system permease protein
LDIFIQQIINGLTLGSVYAVVALGYTMVYGIIQLINFAHGDVVMVGAMTSFTVVSTILQAGTGLSPWMILLVGTIVAIPTCMLLSYLIEKIAYRPLRNAPRLAPLITAIGVSILIQHIAMLIWGRSPIPFPETIKPVSYKIGGAIITNIQIFIILLSTAMMAGLTWLVYKTKMGIAMRATAQNQAVAGLMGVDVNKVISSTFIIGAALAAVAGIMIGTYYSQIQYTMGELLGLKAFCAAVLGGIGNLAGAMLGGVLLGLVEALGTGYIGDFTNNIFGSNYRDVFAFLVLILVLVFRPSGILGERVGDRA